jgi:hypothetical protein
VRYKTPSILLLTALILSKQQSIVPFPSINSSKLKDETACLQANPAQAGVLHISTRFVLQFQQKKRRKHPTINPKNTIDSTRQVNFSLHKAIQHYKGGTSELQAPNYFQLISQEYQTFQSGL